MLQLTDDNTGKVYMVAESLREAVSMNVARYIPSGTCSKGHRSVFMVKSDNGRMPRGVCLECNRERQRLLMAKRRAKATHEQVVKQNAHSLKHYRKNSEEYALKAKVRYYQNQLDKALGALSAFEATKR